MTFEITLRPESFQIKEKNYKKFSTTFENIKLKSDFDVLNVIKNLSDAFCT